jgi:exodeoxyribonuclease V alpha subunit
LAREICEKVPSVPARENAESSGPSPSVAKRALLPFHAVVATEQLRGTLERIVYTNEENHYTVGALLPEGQRETVAVVGNLAGVQCGETLQLDGQWTFHRQFGRQFKVEKYETVLPSSVTGLKKYLGSGLIKGIGPKFAERIVAHFGEQTLEVIDQFSGKLRDVEGIGPQRARQIKEAWNAQKMIREVMIFLQTYGIGASHAAKIFKLYGTESIHVVKQNPYRLAEDVYGIGFKTADQIAHNVGIPTDSAFRVRAGIKHVLQSVQDEGHTCFPHDQLARDTTALLGEGVVEASVRQEIVALANEGELKIEPEQDLVFLAGLHRAEEGVAQCIVEIIRAPHALPPIVIEKAVNWAESRTRLEMSEAQREAIRTVLRSKFTVITGGPGVGKTTIVRAIVQILRAKECKVLMASPTGRAAKRLADATGGYAQTIHRLLKFDPQEHKFVHDRGHPLNANMVIVDESSMLDVWLAHNLFRAIPTSASVVLIGDVDQLPSVGPGNVLRDIIASGRVDVVRLTEIFRQQRESRIVVNAHRINQGQMPEFSKQGAEQEAKSGQDFFLIEQQNPEQVVETIQKLCTERIPKKFMLDPIADIQVLAPMHRGVCGVSNLNRVLQHALNPGSNTIERFGRIYRVGDKIMQTRNNYDLDVFNGDMGRVVALDLIEQKLSAQMDERVVEYDFTDLDELVPAYAISIHKSQGSEYPCVIVPLLTQHFLMLQRNLLYTAVTRGKKLVVLIASSKALAMAVTNNSHAERYGLLLHRLKHLGV